MYLLFIGYQYCCTWMKSLHTINWEDNGKDRLKHQSDQIYSLIAACT